MVVQAVPSTGVPGRRWAETSRNPVSAHQGHLAWAESASTLEDEYLSLISTETSSTHLEVHLQAPPSQRGHLFLILTKGPDRLVFSPTPRTSVWTLTCVVMLFFSLYQFLCMSSTSSLNTWPEMQEIETLKRKWWPPPGSQIVLWG